MDFDAQTPAKSGAISAPMIKWLAGDVGVEPLVTVLVPFHRDIPDAGCVHSLVDQSRSAPPFEVLFLDNSLGAVKEAEDRIRAVIQGRLKADAAWPRRWGLVDASEKRGPSHARNRGLAAASGAWTTMVDSDDTVTQTWMADSAAAFAPGLCITPPLAKKTARGLILAPKAPVVDWPGGGQAILTSWFAETEKMRMARGWNEDLMAGEDAEFSHRLLSTGMQIQTTVGGHYIWKLPSGIKEVWAKGRHYAAGDLELRAIYGNAWPLPFHDGHGMGWWVRRCLLDSLRAIQLRSWHPLLEPAKLYFLFLSARSARSARATRTERKQK